jgi:hypothetical protein
MSRTRVERCFMEFPLVSDGLGVAV